MSISLKYININNSMSKSVEKPSSQHLNMTLIHPSAVSASAASPRELQAPVWLCGVSVSKDAPPARLIPAGRCLQSLRLQSNRCLIVQQATLSRADVCLYYTTSLCKAGGGRGGHKKPTHPSRYQHRHLLFSSLGVKSANPSPVRQTAISVWMEHVARSEGCGCSNWYVWENKIDRGDGRQRGVRRKRRPRRRGSERAGRGIFKQNQEVPAGASRGKSGGGAVIPVPHKSLLNPTT